MPARAVPLERMPCFAPRHTGTMIDFKPETQPDEGGDDSKTLGNMSGAALPDGTRDGAGLEGHVQTTVKVASGPSG